MFTQHCPLSECNVESFILMWLAFLNMLPIESDCTTYRVRKQRNIDVKHVYWFLNSCFFCVVFNKLAINFLRWYNNLSKLYVILLVWFKIFALWESKMVKQLTLPTYTCFFFCMSSLSYSNIGLSHELINWKLETLFQRYKNNFFYFIEWKLCQVRFSISESLTHTHTHTRDLP